MFLDWLTKFLNRPSNLGKAIIKGKRVKRGGGYGLEVPCEYHFQGDDFWCNWLKPAEINERRIRSAQMTFDLKAGDLMICENKQGNQYDVGVKYK